MPDKILRLIGPCGRLGGRLKSPSHGTALRGRSILFGVLLASQAMPAGIGFGHARQLRQADTRARSTKVLSA
jgi:hypothetical protein